MSVRHGVRTVLGMQNLGFANPESMCAIGIASRSGNAKPKFSQLRMTLHRRVRLSFWDCKSKVSPAQNNVRRRVRIDLVLGCKQN